LKGKIKHFDKESTDIKRLSKIHEFKKGYQTGTILAGDVKGDLLADC
jgi:hypothetical protein